MLHTVKPATIEEMLALVRACTISYAVVDASTEPPIVTLVCADSGTAIHATVEQLKALMGHYLLPVNVVRVVSPYLRAA